MSIYATLWSIKVQDPAAPFTNPRWVKATAQAVPPHIGSPTPGCGYETGDPYSAFLPPPLNVTHIAAEISCPALVVHDRGDDDVPVDDGIALAAAWPGARLLITERYGHPRAGLAP